MLESIIAIAKPVIVSNPAKLQINFEAKEYQITQVMINTVDDMIKSKDADGKNKIAHELMKQFKSSKAVKSFYKIDAVYTVKATGFDKGRYFDSFFNITIKEV